jgi:hypothetical protein
MIGFWLGLWNSETVSTERHAAGAGGTGDGIPVPAGRGRTTVHLARPNFWAVGHACAENLEL